MDLGSDRLEQLRCPLRYSRLLQATCRLVLQMEARNRDLFRIGYDRPEVSQNVGMLLVVPYLLGCGFVPRSAAQAAPIYKVDPD